MFLYVWDVWHLIGQEVSGSKGASPASSERLLFPRDMFWGYGQFDLAPPHNEIDPNLCRADAGIAGGVNDPCNAFARYMLSGYVEIRPFGRTQLSRLFLFGEPKFLFGKNLPQTLYTWSFAAIGVEHSWGAGIYLGKGFEMRVTGHACSLVSGRVIGTWVQPTWVQTGLGVATTRSVYGNISGSGDIEAFGGVA